MCKVKSTELMKHLNEEKLEKCSDVSDKLFQIVPIRSQKKRFLASIKLLCMHSLYGWPRIPHDIRNLLFGDLTFGESPGHRIK